MLLPGKEASALVGPPDQAPRGGMDPDGALNEVTSEPAIAEPYRFMGQALPRLSLCR